MVYREFKHKIHHFNGYNFITIRNVVAARSRYYICRWFCSRVGCLADTPSPRADIPLGRHPSGRHPHRQTPPRQTSPQANTIPRQTPSLGRHPPKQTPPRQTPPNQTPPSFPKTATAADGTHPTGIHSCFLCANSVV